MVDDLVKSVRRIATDLRPPILDQLGLPAAVEWLAQDFSRRTGIQCDATVLPTDDAIGDDLATALFRIVQEALTNVLRHAGATCVNIELAMKSGCVALEINDDAAESRRPIPSARAPSAFWECVNGRPRSAASSK